MLNHFTPGGRGFPIVPELLIRAGNEFYPAASDNIREMNNFFAVIAERVKVVCIDGPPLNINKSLLCIDLSQGISHAQVVFYQLCCIKKAEKPGLFVDSR